VRIGAATQSPPTGDEPTDRHIATRPLRHARKELPASTRRDGNTPQTPTKTMWKKNPKRSRALQLIIRNVGGGRPGELDRAVQGGPGKYTFCFAEREDDPSWLPLNVARGFAPQTDTVTLFQGDGIQGFIDQRSRTPKALTLSLARSLMAVGNWKLCEFTNALLVLSPEHYAIYKRAGWTRADIEEALRESLKRPGEEVIQGAHGIGEGVSPERTNEFVDKFWLDGLLIALAGGEAGLFSAICAGWTGGRFRDESKTVTREIAPWC
ncbi:MAG: hypothetical protein AAF405_07620, partial [Pseudomonadota bacterium]